ncbi:SDR family NAD(P)-dependent oxidoreductase [Chloroflexota bacterium]
MPTAKLREQLELNVVGQAAVTQAFLPLARKCKGRIANMGASEGKVAMPSEAPYCASKFALEALTDSLRMELRSRGIPVSIVEPGIIAAPLLERSIAALAEVCARGLPQQAHDLYDPATAASRTAADT